MGTTLTNGGLILTPSATSPVSPVEGQIYYDSSDKIMKTWTGNTWAKYLKDSSDFLYRQIITTSFVMGGYKDSSPWKNVNRMVHATDICTNLGDLLSYSASYSSGAGGKVKGWMFSAANAHSTATTQICAFNMVTETNIAPNSANFMREARNDAGAAWKETEFCYIMSGGTLDKFNFTTETCSLSNTLGSAAILADGTGSSVEGMVDENHALIYGDNTGQILHFSTDTVATEHIESSRYAFSTNAQQKPISSKVGKGYAGNEGTYNGGYNFRKWQLKTVSQNGTCTKPIGNTGEENFDMGQDKQYCLGTYDGAQNNRGHKFTYATDSGYELGSGSLRTGVPGGSSGACCWRA